MRTALQHEINLRKLDAKHVTIALDETTTLEDVDALLAVLNGGKAAPFTAEALAPSVRVEMEDFCSVQCRYMITGKVKAAGVHSLMLMWCIHSCSRSTHPITFDSSYYV